MPEKTGRAIRVQAEVEEIELENEEGKTIPSIKAECSRCGHETRSYGTHERSITRCLTLLREECPEGEDNFYYSEDED